MVVMHSKVSLNVSFNIKVNKCEISLIYAMIYLI